MIVEFTEYDGYRMMGDERFMMYGLAAGCRNIGTHAVEIGTWCGATTSAIARLLPEHQVITVSMPKGAVPTLPHEPSDSRFFGIIPRFDSDVSKRITHIEQDSATITFPTNVQIGFAFIDGSHSEEYVRNDFDKILPHCVPGALVVFHDYGTSNAGGITTVRMAVDKLAAQYSVCKWTMFPRRALAWVIIQ